MKNQKLSWADIDKRKSILLGKTNWTQMVDNGLTEETVKSWKVWRDKVTSANHSNYPTPTKALKALENLRENKPDSEYSPQLKDFFFEVNNPKAFELPDIKQLIREVLNEEKEPNILLDDDANLEEAKKYIQKELSSVYASQIRKASPAPELTQLYVERLNQAIDCLAGVGSSYPLLQVLVDNSNKDLKEIATSILKRHTTMITSFVDIEDRYLKTLKAIKESDKIDQLRQISEKFINGY